MKIFSRSRSGSEAAGQEIPAGRLERLNQMPKRRLGDAIEAVFYRACVQNDLRSAAGLLAVLGDLHARRARIFGSAEHPIEDTSLSLARAELDRCRELNRRGRDGESRR